MIYTDALAMTAEQLAEVRADGQWSKIRAIFVPQQTVLICKCAYALESNDAVQYIPYNFVSGSWKLVKNGMTGYIGTAAGLGDLGMVRVKSIDDFEIKIGRVSGIEWSSEVYITIVDDFGLWAKLPTLDLTTIKMDDDIEYTNQNLYPSPVPIMGPDIAMPYSSGSAILDGSASYCIDGTAITGWYWEISSGSSISGSIASSGSGVASWTFPAPGSYQIHLIVTAANGKTAYGHRSWYLYDEANYKPEENIIIRSLTCNGQKGAGGSQVEIECWGDMSNVRPLSKVILIQDSYISGSSVNQSQVANASKVLMVGWMGDESPEFDKDNLTTKFQLYGPDYWLKQMTGPSTFLESVLASPDAWTSIPNMTMDKVIHHFFYWRSTAMEVLDVFPSTNTRIIGGMSASIGAIWDQVYDTADTRMMMKVIADRYGRIFPNIDVNLLSTSDRTGIPTVMDITTDDLGEKVSIKRTTVNPISLLEVAGLAQVGSEIEMYMARAPGSLIYNRFGGNDQNDRLVVTDQTDANEISGNMLAKKNNEYGSVAINLACNNRMLDIAPPMYVTLTIPATANNRGVTWSNKKFLIERIEYKFNQDTGEITMDLELEAETVGIPGYMVEVPQEPVYNLPTIPDISDYPTIPDVVIDPIPPYNLPQPPIVSGSSSGSACPNGAAANGGFSVYFYSRGSSGWVGDPGTEYLNYVTGSYPCYIRSENHTNQTYIVINGYMEMSASGSAGWAPCLDDTLCLEVRAYQNATAYITAQNMYWLTKPSAGNGNFSLIAYFPDLAANYKTSFFQVNLVSAKSAISNLDAPVPTHKQTGCTYLPTSGSCIMGIQTIPPNEPIAAAFKMHVSGSGLGYGRLHLLTYLEQWLGTGATRYPSSWNFEHPDTSGWSVAAGDTTYSPAITFPGSSSPFYFTTNPYYWDRRSDAVTLANGTWYIGFYYDVGGLMAYSDSRNRHIEQVYDIQWEPGWSSATRISLFNTAFRRLQVKSSKVYNICV